MFLGVLVMMLIGFGYLMTFLKRYGLSALGFTLMVTCISLQWGVIMEVSYDDFEKEPLNERCMQFLNVPAWFGYFC